jgi:hypothetical protein
VSDWLERLRGAISSAGRSPDRAPDTEQARRVAAALGERVLFASESSWLDALLACLGDDPIDVRTIDHLVGALKVPGFYGELADDEAAAHLAFWRRLAERHPGDPVLLAHFAEVEVTLGEPADGLRRLIDAFDRRPELFMEFGWDLEDDARALGGEPLFRWQLHLLRWFISHSEHLESGDEAREVYGTLLEEYADDAARLAQLHPLGDEIQRLEQAGDLPRAMVVRRRRRPRGEAEG